MYRLASMFAVVFLVTARGTTAQPCEWSAVGEGVNDYILAMIAFDDGRGPALYVGGAFDAAGGHLAFGVARWDGEAWSAVGPGLRSGQVYSFAAFDDGRGPALYAGGNFQTSGGKPVRGIAKWDGVSWTEVGGGISGGSTTPTVRALCVFDDGSGPALYAGGTFGSAGGEPGTAFIARWDGESWSPVQSVSMSRQGASGGGMHSWVYTLAVHDDGSGPALYAGGTFLSAGGVPAQRMAKWDGASWSALGEGLDAYPLALADFDDGSGPALYAGGTFSFAGGQPANYLARWDGASWSEVGGGLNKSVVALSTFDGGTGTALYVGGGFTMAGDTHVGAVTRWDGKAWAPLGSGVGGSPSPWVQALAGFQDDAGPTLYAGGVFLTAGGVSANRIARWQCAAPPCYADCDGSGELDFFDFLCFQNLFAAADPRADCDASGALDFFDFLCFQNAFAAGCP